MIVQICGYSKLNSSFWRKFYSMLAKLCYKFHVFGFSVRNINCAYRLNYYISKTYNRKLLTL